jgi:hypothetical protein
MTPQRPSGLTIPEFSRGRTPQRLAGFRPDLRDNSVTEAYRVYRPAGGDQAHPPAGAEHDVGRSRAEVLGRPTEGIQELGWVIYSILTKPMYYAAQIEEERITLPVALSYLGMLAVVLAIIEGIAGLHEMTIVDMPVLDEVLTFLLLVVLQVAVALILWMGLRAVGGKGTYKKTLIAQITLTVALLPLTTMVDACAFTANHQIYQEMTVSPGSRMMNGLNGLYVLPVLSVVHKISRTRVFFGSLVGVLAVSLAVLVVLFFMGLFSSS